MPGLRPPIAAPGRTRPRAHGTLAAAFVAIAFTSAGTPARADCIDDAAAWHQVNAQVLRAIGWQESRLNPSAIGRNANGSTDFGAFQINSAHLPELARFGVTAQSLADGCVSAYVAAWHYRRQVDRFGNTWAAVGAYHSRTPALAASYAARIASVLQTWGVPLQTGPSDLPAAH
jgi:soluble lytic murein transglycosylase-like protein